MGRPGVRLGAKHTDEAKAKISASQTGRKMSDETRAKMSAAHKARLVGKERTPAQLEASRKTHEACKGRIPWNKGHKKVS